MTRRARSRLISTACMTVLAVMVAVVPVAAGTTSDSVDDPVVSTPGWLGNVPGLGEVAPDRVPPDGALELEGCTITNPLFPDDPERFFPDDPERARTFVPDGYARGTNAYFIVPEAATVMVAVLRCAQEGEDLDFGPFVLSLVAVQVEAEPTGDGALDQAWDGYNSQLNFLPSSSWYLLAAHTDNAALSRRLRGAGLPVVFVEDLEHDLVYDTRDGSGTPGMPQTDVLDVPSPGRYGLATTTLFPDPFVHNHDWTFRYGPPGGRTGFLLHLHAMRDSSCGYHLSPHAHAVDPSCGTTLTAEPGSRIADLLDARDCERPPGPCHRHTPYAFNHPPSDSPGYFALFPSDLGEKRQP